MSRSPKQAQFSSAREVHALAERRTYCKRAQISEVAAACRYSLLQRTRKSFMRRNKCLRYPIGFHWQPECSNQCHAPLRSFGDRLHSSVPTNLDLSGLDLSARAAVSGSVQRLSHEREHSSKRIHPLGFLNVPAIELKRSRCWPARIRHVLVTYVFAKSSR